MKKSFFLIALCLLSAACQKDNNGSQTENKPLEGLYINTLTNDENDRYLLGLSFGDNHILDINEFSVNTDSIIVNVSSFTMNYDLENKEGMIYPVGHDFIDSIYVCQNEDNQFVMAYMYYDGDVKNLKDSVQVFSLNNNFFSFILEQKQYSKEFFANPHCIGPANENELDKTKDIGLDVNFIVPEDTKLAITATAAATWFGTTLLNTTASYGITTFYNSLFKSDNTTAENEKKLDKILAQTKQINEKLVQIQDQLKQLDSKFDRKAVSDKISKRNAMYAAIHEVNYRYYNQLKDLNKNATLMADTTKLNAEIIKIVTEWGATTVDGSPAYTSLKRISSMILDNVSGRNMFQVYDVFAFNTHNFENEGYTDREDFRASDLAIMAECGFLTKMFYLANKEMSMVKENEGYLQQFIKFYNNNQVKRRTDKCICQIAGAHLILEKKPRRITYENPSWISGVIVTGNRDDRMSVNTARIIHADQATRFIKPEEAQCIMNAYGGEKDLHEIFSQHGICEKINDSEVYIPLSSGHTFGWPKARGYYYSQDDMPGWMDINIRTINTMNSKGYNQYLGRMGFSGKKSMRTERHWLIIKKQVFDTWHLSYSGWQSQKTTTKWWNYDVATRY